MTIYPAFTCFQPENIENGVKVCTLEPKELLAIWAYISVLPMWKLKIEISDGLDFIYMIDKPFNWIDFVHYTSVYDQNQNFSQMNYIYLQ